MIAPSDFDNSRPPALPSFLEAALKELGLVPASAMLVASFHIDKNGKITDTSPPCNHGTDHAPDKQGQAYGTYDHSDLKPFIDGKQD